MASDLKLSRRGQQGSFSLIENVRRSSGSLSAVSQRIFRSFFFAGWLPAFCFFGVSRANQLAMLGSVRIRNSTFTVRRSVILLLPLTALSSAFVFPWMSRLVRTTAVLRALRRSGRSDSMPVVRWFGPTRRDLVGLLTTACRFCYCRRCWIAAAAARACVFR